MYCWKRAAKASCSLAKLSGLEEKLLIRVGAWSVGVSGGFVPLLVFLDRFSLIGFTVLVAGREIQDRSSGGAIEASLAFDVFGGPILSFNFGKGGWPGFGIGDAIGSQELLT